MIRVVAIVTAKPGRRDELLELFKANVPSVLAEQGCHEYVPVVDASRTPANMGPDTFVVIETWESMEALVAHGSAPHMLAYRAASKDLVAGASVHFLSPA
jgi:quinol monooxygenase YgiN